MNNYSESYNNIITETEDQLIEAVRNFSRTFVEASSGNNGIPTIMQLENMWTRLNDETRNIYGNLISGVVNTCDESRIISSKKANT